MPRPPDRQPTGQRRGFILIVVLWIVAVIAFIGVTFSFQTATDNKVTYYLKRRLAAELLAESAIERARAELALDDPAYDGLDEPWAFDVDGSYFTYQPVWAGSTGVYSVLGRPADPDDAEQRPVFGLVDECGKVNINTADREMLAALPGLTEEIADAIIDWRDSNLDPEPLGAEEAAYASLPVPYRPKNGPFESVDELLLVRGMTSRLLYGEDANRNGRLDPNEDDADETPPDDDGNGELDLGLYRYITVWSRTPNVDAEGNRRINLNAPWQQLGQQLGPVLNDPQLVAAIVTVRRQRAFKGIGDLLDVPGMTPEAFGAVADRVTTSQAREVRGLINPNTAPIPVLAALGLSAEDAAKLDAVRTSDPGACSSLTWLVNAIGSEAFKPIAGKITLRSHQFSFEALGQFTAPADQPPDPIFRRLWVVLDRRQSPASIVFRQDLTPLGPAYPPPAGEDYLVAGGV